MVVASACGTKRRTRQLRRSLPTAFAAGTNLLKSFVDLAALFRTDTKIDGKAVTIEEAALVAEIFRSLKNDYGKEEINLYYPEVFHPRVPPSSTDNNARMYSTTVTTIGTLFIAKKEADRIIKALNTEKAEILKNMKDPSEARAKLAEQLEKRWQQSGQEESPSILFGS